MKVTKDSTSDLEVLVYPTHLSPHFCPYLSPFLSSPSLSEFEKNNFESLRSFKNRQSQFTASDFLSHNVLPIHFSDIWVWPTQVKGRDGNDWHWESFNLIHGSIWVDILPTFYHWRRDPLTVNQVTIRTPFINFYNWQLSGLDWTIKQTFNRSV